MKEYMDGLRWDTSKAEKVAEHKGEPAHIETLYHTPTGRWFLVYTFQQPGTAFNPLTDKQVLSWMKDHQLMEAIDQNFPGEIADA